MRPRVLRGISYEEKVFKYILHDGTSTVIAYSTGGMDMTSPRSAVFVIADHIDERITVFPT